MDIELALLEKYNVPVPRYTSYPTVPFWKEEIDIPAWKNNFLRQFQQNNKKEGISLYLHLPFCEALCTYCGCNKKITTNHSVEEEYIAMILKEWQMYLQLMGGEKPIVRELHLGGGTPTFFSPANLKILIEGILEHVNVHKEHEFSLEGHPNNTTREHLQTLYNLGFRRVSYGVQDNDPEVQRIINRIQPFSNVVMATQLAREIGYTSVNFDLIYGLPKQTLESIKCTVTETISLKPDRIAFYCYAHVPWTSKGQRLFDTQDLPPANLKLQLYQLAKHMFLENGYADIGMDHFALPSDQLYQCREQGKLHRNFMGYTTQPTKMLIGLGVSSISDTGNAYAQNEKKLQHYYDKINAGELAVVKSCFLTAEDELFKQHILNISCRGVTNFQHQNLSLLETYTSPKLKVLEQDGLIELDNESVKLTSKGHHFLRNVCSAFDLHLLRASEKQEVNQFSKAI